MRVGILVSFLMSEETSILAIGYDMGCSFLVGAITKLIKSPSTAQKKKNEMSTRLKFFNGYYILQV